MASGLPSNPGILGRFVNALAGRMGGKDQPKNAMDRIARNGLSERQQELNYLWGVYRGQQYSHRKLDWNGRENVGRLDAEVIGAQGYIPPGFYDASGQGGKFPLKFRRPTSPYALVKVIVDRFTGLLFSEQRHPEIKVDGDPDTEDWLRAVADATRLWQQLIQTRTYGGSMGSAAIGFQFIEGKPVIEVHDPRWVIPEFSEHGSTTLISIEKRYQYPKEERDEATGKWETKLYWYRRVIDQERDTLFQPALVEESGEEPKWEVGKEAVHNFGFVPVIWVQNLPLQDSEDGDGDCPPAVYDNVETIDALIAQANRSILANCDPQLVLTTKAEMTDVQLGPNNALRVPDGDAKFLEVRHEAAKAGMELADELRKNVLEMVSCVLEHPDVSGKTATEVERLYESMIAKADILREQYGQKCVIPLLEMIYRAAQALGQPQPIPQPSLPQGMAGETGQVLDAAARLGASPGPAGTGGTGSATPGGQEQQDAAVNSAEDPMMRPQTATVRRLSVILPPKYERQSDGSVVKTERNMGSGGTITLKWPDYFQPSLDDVNKAATAAVAAMGGGVIDDETAIGFTAPFFKVEDKQGLVEKVRASAAKQQADMMAQMASASPPNDPAGGGSPGGGAPPGL